MNEQNLSLKLRLKNFFILMLPQFLLIFFLLVIFGLLFFLSRTPLALYWYGVQLSLFFLLISIVFQWLRYSRKIQRAESFHKLGLEVDKSKLDRADIAEKIYQKQYRKLTEEYLDYKQRETEKNKEQMEYFSLWLHQIKTPIAAISLLVQQNKEVSGQKQMEQELLRLDDYTHMALNYLKLEDIGKELDLEWVSIDEIIKETLKKYSILFIYNKIQLIYKPLEKNFLTDRQWLQVLVEQILSNSLKYTKTGKISIFLENGHTLVIEDTGAGIRQEDLPKIFEKGYTGLNGRLHEKSTGLGLFLSKKICNRLGHGLHIESELGSGTKVYIDFKRPDFQLFD